MEKKERARRYHISTKDNQAPLVTLAKDEADARKRWAKRTGRAEKEAVVTLLGSRAETIARSEKPGTARQTAKSTAAAEKGSEDK